MRILQLHSNFIQYIPLEKEIDVAEKCEKEERRFDEIVVLFICIEEWDDENVVDKALFEIKDALKNLNTNRVLIYPYAHLSSDLAKPIEALSLLRQIEVKARKIGIETYSAPFGWNKQFVISIKGHPLAEQFKVILPDNMEKQEKISEALGAEKKLKSLWFVLQKDGRMSQIDDFDFKNHEVLRKFARYEMVKVRAVQRAPPHVNLMRRLEIADYELGSDQGNFRWYPKGRLIKSLLEEFVTQEVIDYGAMEVETPIMYDFNHPSLSSYLNRFPARQYVTSSGKREFFLRFSACFGQFLMIKDSQVSYRHLPLKIYELTKYSFRREKSGELAGLRRLRTFTMPDCHAMCSDLEQAKKEIVERLRLSIKILEDGLGLERKDYEMAIRFTREFYEKNHEFINLLVKLIDKPVLIELWEKRFFYFVFKWEFNFIDNQSKASALSTDQIDIENAERYGITYVNEEGEKKKPSNPSLLTKRSNREMHLCNVGESP